MKLTQELIAEASDKATPSALALPNKDLHEVSCLKALVNLVRLDLSHNRIQSIEALSNCKSLKWLSVARNDLQSLHGVESLSNLMVLNGSSNQITSIKEVEGLHELRALIVNDNHINAVCSLQKLTALNTLVLSKNPITGIGTSLEKVSSLVKLSLSNCELQDLGSLKGLANLKELRLAQNKIKHLSKDLSKNSQLRIIDLGSNYLRQLSDIEVLSTLPWLKNLNVRGNPLCLQNNYEDKVKTLLPNLQVLDGHLVKSSQKKRHLEHQSALPSTTELSKECKVEVFRTSKKLRQDDKAVKAGKGEDAQLSDHHLKLIKKQERHQEVGKAGKDRGTEKADMSHDKKTRQASQSVKSGSDENKPFIELIAQEEPVTQVAKEVPHSGQKKKKDNSGLVSIIHNQSKVSKLKKSKHHDKISSVVSLSMGEVEVGSGGVSSWD